MHWFYWFYWRPNICYCFWLLLQQKNVWGGSLILKRAKSLLIPFIFFSIGTYFIQCLSGLLSINLLSFLNWIIGNENWLYFVPALFICYVVFTVYIFNFNNELVALILCLLINIVGLNTDITFINALPRFLLFFTVGYVIKQHNTISLMKCNVFHIILTIVIFLTLYYMEVPIILDRILHIIISLEIINISYYLKDIHFIVKIGKITYPIYFLHAQVGIGLSNIVMQLILGYNVKTTLSFLVMFIRPSFALLISVIITKFISYISNSLKIEKILPFIGIKE